MDIRDYQKILSNWGLGLLSINQGTDAPEHPDQNDETVVVTDESGAKWVLELFTEDAYARKLAIAETLELIENHECPFVHPFQRNTLGQFITFYSGHLCMLRPLAEGKPAENKHGLAEEWRAAAIASFLKQLHLCSRTAPIKDDGKAFAIIDFVKRRMETFERHRPDVAESLSPVYALLEAHLFPVLATLPTTFAHGNLKPTDIIWGKDAIQSVLNWDYCGTKPEAYDLAVLLGCLGFEHPDALVSSFSKHVIQQLKDASIYAEGTWDTLFDLVVASRYNWLTEWMRTNNEKKRDLEILYMNLLVTQRNYIIRKWAADEVQ